MAGLVLSCVFYERRREKKSSFRNKPHYKQHSRMYFYKIRTRRSLAVRAFSALDTRLLTKRSRVASAPCPAHAPVSAPTTAGDMPHPEEGPPERTPGPLETPWRCSFGYPDGVGKRSLAVEPSPCLSHPAGHPLQQAATGCGLKPLAHPSIQLEFNDTLMVYCIYLYVSF